MKKALSYRLPRKAKYNGSDVVVHSLGFGIERVCEPDVPAHALAIIEYSASWMNGKVEAVSAHYINFLDEKEETT